MTAPLLALRAVSVAYGPVTVLRPVDLDLVAGTVLGIAGESGSGKSTLALATLGLLPAAARMAGSVRWQGAPVDPSDLRGRLIGYIPQDPLAALDPCMRVGEQVAEGLRIHGMGRAEARTTAAAWLARVGLPEGVGGRWPHELSGGMRQRAVIAGAMAPGPRVLIADEPTTALDVTMQGQILDLLAWLRRTEDLALLLISHDLPMLSEIADRIAVLYAGHLVEEGAAGQILDAPRHPYSAALRAAAPLPGLARLPDALPGTPPDLRALPPGCVFAPRCAQVGADCAAVPPVRVDVAGRIACWRA